MGCYAYPRRAHASRYLGNLIASPDAVVDVRGVCQASPQFDARNVWVHGLVGTFAIADDLIGVLMWVVSIKGLSQPDYRNTRASSPGYFCLSLLTYSGVLMHLDTVRPLSKVVLKYPRYDIDLYVF